MAHDVIHFGANVLKLSNGHDIGSEVPTPDMKTALRRTQDGIQGGSQILPVANLCSAGEDKDHDDKQDARKEKKREEAPS